MVLANWRTKVAFFLLAFWRGKKCNHLFLRFLLIEFLPCFSEHFSFSPLSCCYVPQLFSWGTCWKYELPGCYILGAVVCVPCANWPCLPWGNIVHRPLNSWQVCSHRQLLARRTFVKPLLYYCLLWQSFLDESVNKRSRYSYRSSELFFCAAEKSLAIIDNQIILGKVPRLNRLADWTENKLGGMGSRKSRSISNSSRLANILMKVNNCLLRNEISLSSRIWTHTESWAEKDLGKNTWE